MGTWLFGAAHMKAVPGRRSDVHDAEWIAQLLEHGLVARLFVPRPAIRRLRNLTRYRVQLMGDRMRDAVRLEKLLEDASIKLSAVASSVTTVSARAMLGELAGHYGVPYTRERGKTLVASMLGGLMPSLAGHQVLKAVGPLLGGAVTTQGGRCSCPGNTTIK